MLLFIQLYAILFYLAIGNASPMLFFLINLQYVKSTVKMDVCLRDNLIIFRSFAKHQR